MSLRSQLLEQKRKEEKSRKKAKSKIAKERMKICKENGINLHYPDHFIISDFMEEGINLVYAEDGEVIKACKFLNLNAERLIFNVEREIKEQLRRLPMFQRKYKKFKKRRK